MLANILTLILFGLALRFIIIPIVIASWRKSNQDSELRILRQREQHETDERDRARLRKKYHV